jgi:hypothetical protein
MSSKIILISLIIFFLLFYYFYFYWYSLSFSPPGKKPPIFPPDQPEVGPGGKDYLTQKVEVLELRKEGEVVFLFIPEAVNLDSQPVVLVLPGLFPGDWSGFSKTAGLFHLAKKGNIVIAPVYQKSLFEPFNSSNLANRAYELTKEAIVKVREIAPKNDLSNFAVLGLSSGGAVATYIITSDLPRPKVLILIVPIEGLPLISPRLYGLPFEDLKSLSYHSFLLGILAEKDRIVSQSRIEKLFNQAFSKEKHLFKIPSDTYGNPPIVSNHINFFNQFNALNFYSCFKLVDATLNCAFYYRDCSIAKGESEEAFSTGRWSDGKAVNRIIKIPLK